MAARKPVQKPAAKKPVKKAAPKAAAKKPAKKPAAVATASGASLADQLAKALRLDAEVVLERALRSFASAHGVALQDAAPVAAPAPEPVATPEPAALTVKSKIGKTAKPAKAEKHERGAPGGKDPAPGELSGDSLLPQIRVFVQTKGRPALEMVNEEYFVGSNNKCDLWVAQPQIEGRHIRIFRHGGKCYVEDLNTTHNTKFHSDWIGGKGPVELGHEDTVYLAGYHPVRVYLHKGVR